MAAAINTKYSRALIIAVALGIAGSIVIVPLTYLQIAATLSHAYLVALTLGLWVVPCLLPIATIRKPGSSLIACAAIGVISATTTPYGLPAISALLFEGVIVELPFLVTLYKRWSTVQLYISGLLLGAIMGYMMPSALGAKNFSFALHMGCVGIAVVSAIIGSWLSIFIAKKVRKTGVLG